jgi:hypothetical protein
VGWLQIGLAGGLLLAPATVWFGAIGHTQTYWLYLVGFVWALSRRQVVGAGVWLGFCIMSRHTVWPLLPIVGIYSARCLEPRARWRLLAATAVPVVALTLPFGAKGMRQFLIESPLYYAYLGEWAWNGARWWITHTFGLGVFLYPVGLGRALPWLGALLLVGVYWLAYRGVRDLASCVRFLALALLVVTITIATPFRYEFIPLVLLLSVLTLVRAWEPTHGPTGEPNGPVGSLSACGS